MNECCRNCKLLLELYKHPCNKSKKFKGNINETTNLYACIIYSKLKGSRGEAIIFEENMLSGLCECYAPNES